MISKNLTHIIASLICLPYFSCVCWLALSVVTLGLFPYFVAVDVFGGGLSGLLLMLLSYAGMVLFVYVCFVFFRDYAYRDEEDRYSPFASIDDGVDLFFWYMERVLFAVVILIFTLSILMNSND